MIIIAREGDICNEDGTVTKACAEGVPSRRDTCRCGPQDGFQCKKGNVCLENKCYGKAVDATGKYCTDSGVCTTACGCADAEFAQAEMCYGRFKKCENFKLITLKCTSEASVLEDCKCSENDERSCSSKSARIGEVCYEYEKEGGVCETYGSCSAACACVNKTAQNKMATLCSGEEYQCYEGTPKNPCKEKGILSKSCYCNIISADICAQGNICISDDCYGAGDGVEGDFCTNNETCGTKCACKAADGKTAAVYDGSSKFCSSGEVRDLCADKTVNSAACRCAVDSTAACTVQNVCISSQCYGNATGADAGRMCESGAACGTKCACALANGKTAALCDGASKYCGGGVIYDVCEPNTVLAAPCRCSASDSSECAAGGICIAPQCYGNEPGTTGDYCFAGAYCKGACVCVSEDESAVLVCPQGYEEKDGTCEEEETREDEKQKPTRLAPARSSASASSSEFSSRWR